MASSSLIPSPKATLLPFISPEEADKLAYPPNALPGARDVRTFYGSIRVHEWGSVGGKKVLFVHGDATPCLLFSKIAQGLVDAGYRVMLFDLWGRGYSDTPLGCRHDNRLFASEILLALTSSPLSWLGNKNSFHIVGFSLGGPISLTFTATFPTSVDSLVLLGPAGLIRDLPPGYDGQYMHRPELAQSPEVLREAVREILEVAPTDPALLNNRGTPRPAVVQQEGPSRVDRVFDMAGLLQWQFDYHKGHVHSFQDTVRYGPLCGREDLWSEVCDIIAGRTCPESALHNTKLLLFFGEDDSVVVGKETVEDIEKFLPSNHMQVEYLPGGHGFPYPNSEQITKTILAFWKPKLSTL